MPPRRAGENGSRHGLCDAGVWNGYVSTPGADGRFRFSSYAAPGASIQRFSIESRWQNGGAGRSDVIVNGGGLSQPATANGCWDASFKSQYLHTSYDPAYDYGSETVCVFTPAEYSPL